MPAEARKYVAPLHAEYETVRAAEAAARPRHVADACSSPAAPGGVRSPKRRSRACARSTTRPSPRKAITTRRSARCSRASWSRRRSSIASSSRVETAAAKPLNDWELASRLSFFLWSSIPDDELRRAAAAGELSDPQQLRAQVKRMPADPKARRLATEFFGQWLGFYHFDQYPRRRHRPLPRVHRRSESVDVRRGRLDLRVHRPQGPSGARDPLRRLHVPEQAAGEVLRHRRRRSKSTERRWSWWRARTRSTAAALLRLGAVLTTTSAPLRTSPVKRGDWVLRRILGTPTPPPPADAGIDPGRRQALRRPDAARSAGRAQAQRHLRQLPPAHRSARLPARGLRFHRPLARDSMPTASRSTITGEFARQDRRSPASRAC